ncbi:hypothetical protein Vretifemale_16998, partial [Volvox reticuliferus]
PLSFPPNHALSCADFHRQMYLSSSLSVGIRLICLCWHPFLHITNLRYAARQLLTFGPAAFQPLSRRLRIAIGTVLGVCGLPIPHPQPLFMCIGRPIRVPYTDPRDPCFEQRVEEVAEQVVDAYRRMYKQYGSEYGWSDRPLEVC